ncbi:MAG: serine hydrolase [Bacteroidetes bacterium CG12_big_fil_rev_8_21_14_0_65_60_17]|nr:MAG: serine hydrolase [Bacteroidetes bacterium CG12_big_fil_rev_8_21_14_0_65_60_17]
MNRPHLLLLFLSLLLGAACASPGNSPESISSTPSITMSNELEEELNRIVNTFRDNNMAEGDSAVVAVSIVDPSSRHGAGTAAEFHMNGNRLFHAASTMKLPVMIEVFRRAERGDFAMDDTIVLRNSFRSIVDGEPFSIVDDSDDASYDKLGQPMSLADLTYNMIIVSSNLATNLLIDELTADSVQATSERLGTTHMKTLRGVEDLKAFERGMNNQATSHDLALLLTRLMNGTAVNARSDAAMRQILLDQKFNEIIPAGLPSDVRVAHKTGQITRINHDAAIVYPPGDDPYVLVILMEGISDHDASARLGAELARAIHGHLRGKV